MTGEKVVVVGGGIGGLAVAGGLRRAGFDAQVFERSPTLSMTRVGMRLWYNALYALERLGLDDMPPGFLVPDHEPVYWDPLGKRLFGAPENRPGTFTGETRVLVHRGDLQQHLLTLLGPECVHPGKLCLRVEEFPHHVTAYFADGTEASGDLLIGADGLNSVVRSGIHGKHKPSYTGYTSWQSLVSFDHARLRVGETWGRGARFAQNPLVNGEVYWYATANAPAGVRSPDGEKAELLRRFEGWHDPIPQLIQASDEALIVRTDIADRPPLDSWIRGRVVLLGDAAHPMTPNLSQGACQALEDAMILTECLRDSPRYEVAFARYQKLRMPVASRVTRLSRQVGVIGQLEHPLAVWLRNGLARQVLDHLPSLLVLRLKEAVLQGDFRLRV